MKADDNSSASLLKRDLQSLRKGAGLSIWKLEKSEVLLSTIAGHLGTSHPKAAPADAYDYLIQLMESLGDSVEAQATRNAFGVGVTPSKRSLTDRRAVFADKFGRHPDTIEVFENHGIDELAQRVLGGAAGGPGTTAAKTASTDAARLMLSNGLDALYDLGGRADDILKNFETGRTTFLDTNIELRLADSKLGKGWFSVELRYVFTARLQSFRLGVTTGAHETDILMASGLVDEVAQFLEVQDLDANASRVVSHSRLSVLTASQVWEQLPFKQLDRSEHLRAAATVWQIPENSFLIFDSQSAGGHDKQRPARYEFVQTCDFLTDPQYAYWQAPKMMHINSLLVDTSQFRPNPNPEFRIRPHLGALAAESFDSSQTRLNVTARGWIMPGNGVWILWNRPSEK